MGNCSYYSEKLGYFLGLLMYPAVSYCNIHYVKQPVIVTLSYFAPQIFPVYNDLSHVPTKLKLWAYNLVSSFKKIAEMIFVWLPVN